MIIRKMTEADLPQVHAIELETFSDPWSEEDFLSSLREPNNGYLVAELDGVIAGYCGYWGIVDEGYIYNVAVKKEYRRNQIGYRMLKTLLDESSDRGITSFTLEVRYSNEPAIRLYESLGFERAGIRRDFYSKPKEDAAIMWWKPIQ
ncbi:MAG TPA: ribosomal protein S18-alanine N-acetyltransferase [Mobilitalea sp.]|nr:ribosomal protein S18-alanine N-acetyltransferase [Mobilitalea sp.]